MSKKPDEYKTGELARALKVNSNTVRSWADTYAALLSSGATANKRTYTPEDALLLATVAEMRNAGVSFDAIREALETGQRIGAMPDIPTPEEKQARESAALVPQAERDALAAQLEQEKQYRQYLEGELATMRSERDNLLQRLESETSDIREAWRNEVAELNQRIEAMQQQLAG
ncbi:MAG: MerR family transcriptional regulator, partial [Anaerolineae bacterium]|nr:MerR family transcriptional regulator [Anaerolineae bacterium]